MTSFNLLAKVLNFSAERYLRTAGDLFIYDGDYESALVMVDKTLEIEPTDTRALVLRGDILYCLNRDLESLQTFNKVLALNPACIEAHISKAGVLDILGRHREALDACKRAHQLIASPRHYLLPSLYDQMILLLLRLKKFREARRLLGQAVRVLLEEDSDYLLASYRSIIEHFCEQRSANRQLLDTPTLRVIPGGKAG